ncbi:glycoside hydrolase family 55 protein [Flavihumibacter profundi]|uniref:glycoside hydrolase family 55 protein n=1 Tax=Flavihumibacter profundi TaxID=2716883 RepID=UPI001CC5B032|nr:glycoside hydrolase family 55 protein [Flavihumibacter profundi]MBZ5858023.1 glycoside hydrolase family 55 protein [Flavihumibacter profundi]
MRFLWLLLLPLFSSAQIDPKVFGAVGDGKADDYKPIQAAIDSAISVSGTVYLPGKYRISRSLIAAKWTGKEYVPFTIKIIGNATMWDTNNNSVITATFKDAPALGIHRGKGIIVSGLNFQGAYRTPKMSDSAFYNSDFKTYGDPTCRDAQYSPYAAIVIDPFRDKLPPDGGYPPLKEYYRGSASQGGSTGIRIEDCTINNFTIGIIASPNGQTANAELMTYENIRFYNNKVCIAGCQAQEKSNRIINVGAWGRTHTFLSFGDYGNGTPGFYTVDGVNIAGGVVQFLNRTSGGYFPLFVTHVFAESIGRIGNWQSLVGDQLSNSLFDFAYPENTGIYPDAHLTGYGVTLTNCNFRYYGRQDIPIFFNGEYIIHDCVTYMPIVFGLKSKVDKPGYNFEYLPPQALKITGNKSVIKCKGSGVKPGDAIFFMHYASWQYIGMARVDDVKDDNITIKFISNSVKPDVTYGIGLYVKKQ